MVYLSLDLVGGANKNEATVGSRYCATDKNQVVGFINLNDCQIANGYLLITVLAGHFLTLFGATEASVRCQR
jgi:hypothetical protein